MTSLIFSRKIVVYVVGKSSDGITIRFIDAVNQLRTPFRLVRFADLRLRRLSREKYYSFLLADIELDIALGFINILD